MQYLRTLTNEACQLASRFERFPLAVFQVLDNHHIQDSERTRLFGVIMKEVAKRKKSKKIPSIGTEEKELDEEVARDKNERMLRDAYAHQMRQPPSTWDPNHPENSP